MKNRLQKLAITINSDLVRDDTMEGEEYWVAPMAMMMECVANGSQGPLFYPASEIENSVPSWNHKPIVSPDHPKEGSACTKEFLDSNKIGVVLNTNWDGKLRSEGWFNKKRTSKIVPKVAEALKQRRMMELSTGLYVDPVGNKGKFNNEDYDAVATNFRPDHLAILPDKVGAFSIKKGAGLLQLNEASFNEITSKLEVVLSEKYADSMKEMPSLYLYVMSVYSDYCIYCFGGAYYKIGYSTSADKVSLVGDPVKVERQTEYVPVKNEDEERELDMSKKELIDKIIKNTERSGCEESDRPVLEKLDEKKLAKIANNSELTVLEAAGVKITSQKELDEAVAKGVEEAIGKDPLSVKNKAEELLKKQKPADPPPANDPPINNNVKELTPEQYMAMMPPAMKAVWNNALNSYGAEVSQLSNIILNNKQNQFTKEQLAQMGQQDINMLRNMAKLAASATPVETQTFAMPNYFGMGGAGNVLQLNANPTVEEEGMSIPVYNAEKFANASK